MKALVMEIHKNKVAVMTEDGSFKKIKNKNYTIGQQITLTSIKAKMVALYTSVTASISAFVIALGMYFMPYGTVCLDVNPSIEYQINRFDIVLSANALNDDGSVILEDLSVKNQKISTAIDSTISKLQDDGYLQTSDTNYVMLSSNTKSEEHTEKLAENLGQTISESKKELRIMSEVNTDEEIEKAKEFGISPGKMKLINRISEDASIDDWKDKPVADIMHEINKEKPDENQGPSDKPSTEEKPTEEKLDDEQPIGDKPEGGKPTGEPPIGDKPEEENPTRDLPVQSENVNNDKPQPPNETLNSQDEPPKDRNDSPPDSPRENSNGGPPPSRQ